MNEQLARDVVLVRAIETADAKREVLSDDDRMYASRSARELAQWQAADSKTAATLDHFLQQRSEQILKRLAERTPALGAFLHRRPLLPALSVLLPVLGLLAGAALDRIADPHRVDLLSAPLLLIIGWNLLVYLILLVWPLVPRKDTGWPGRACCAGSPSARPRCRASCRRCWRRALTHFMAEWARLRQQRCARRALPRGAPVPRPLRWAPSCRCTRAAC